VQRERARTPRSASKSGGGASTAKRHGFTVATRDASPFEAAGLTVINPWTDQH